MTLPEQDREVVAELSDAVESAREGDGRGAVAAVIAGRGGAGASLFATALACTATDGLLSMPTRGAVASTWPWVVRPSPACAGLTWHCRAVG